MREHITICVIVKAEHDRGFRFGIRVRSRGSKDQSALTYHLYCRETCAPTLCEHAQSTTFGILVEASLFMFTGWLHIHLFYLSKLQPHRKHSETFYTQGSWFITQHTLIDVNPFTLRSPLEPNICYFHTFENNFRTKRKFTKYLKESCSSASNKHFSFKCSPENAFVSNIFSYLIGLF